MMVCGVIMTNNNIIGLRKKRLTQNKKLRGFLMS